MRLDYRSATIIKAKTQKRSEEKGGAKPIAPPTFPSILLLLLSQLMEKDFIYRARERESASWGVLRIIRFSSHRSKMMNSGRFQIHYFNLGLNLMDGPCSLDYFHLHPSDFNISF